MHSPSSEPAYPEPGSRSVNLPTQAVRFRWLGLVITIEAVQRFVESERQRSRRVLLGTSTIFLLVVILVLALFILIGIVVLGNSRRGGRDGGRHPGGDEAVRLEVAGVSNRIFRIETAQENILSEVQDSEAQRRADGSVLKSDLERFSRWGARGGTSRDARALAAMDARSRELEEIAVARQSELAALKERYDSVPSPGAPAPAPAAPAAPASPRPFRPRSTRRPGRCPRHSRRKCPRLRRRRPRGKSRL